MHGMLQPIEHFVTAVVIIFGVIIIACVAGLVRAVRRRKK